MGNALGFLNQEKQAHLPVGGDFLPSGFIALAKAQVLESFMSKEDSQNGSYDAIPPYVGRAKRGDWFLYYYNTKAAAVTAAQMLGVEGLNGKPPTSNTVWSLVLNRDSVLNFADQEKLAKFPNPIVFDVDLTSLKSKKRHAFHMLALPAAVQAAAKALSFSYEPFVVEELTNQDTIYTDDFQHRMIGNAEAKKGEDNFYESSVLWQRRAALWKSLGEDDATAYTMLGSEKFATKSDKLSQCLSIVSAAWDQSPYVRLITVADPHMKAQYSDSNGESKQRQIGLLWDIFPSKAAAETAAREDLARLAKNAEKASTNGAVPSISAPKSWIEGGFADEWPKTVAEVKAKYAAVPNIPILNKMARDLNISVDEVKSIWN